MNKFRIIKFFLEDVLNIIIVFYFNVLKGKLFFRYVKKIDSRNNLVIIGSGPSIKQDFNEIQSIDKLENDFLAFNSFINSTLSEEIKPNLYMLVDPAFFASEKFLKNAYVKKKINDTWNKLEKTNWNMILIIPSKFKNSKRIQKVRNNHFIEITEIHEKPIIGGSKNLNYYIFRHGLGHPLFQNILIAGLVFAITNQYRSISIYGSDHSFHELLEIDNKTNNLLNNEGSVGSKESKVAFMDFKNQKLTISWFFLILSITFRSYEILDFIANKKEILIINKASKSYIDAFKRK